MFTIFMLAAEKHKGTFLAPVGIGLALFSAELAGVYYTGGTFKNSVIPRIVLILNTGSLNPARSFGPCVALRTFPSYHWIYWLGPALGALIAVGLYRFVKVLEYETANPGQDFNEKEAEVFTFDEDNAATGADVARPIVAIGNPDYTADRSGITPSGSRDGATSLDSGHRLGSSAKAQGSGSEPANKDLHPGFADSYGHAPNAEEGKLWGNYRPSSDHPEQPTRA